MEFLDAVDKVCFRRGVLYVFIELLVAMVCWMWSLR